MWMMPHLAEPPVRSGQDTDGARHREDRRQPWEWCVDGPAAGR